MSKLSFSQFQKICLPPDILNRPVDKRFMLFYMRKVSIRITWLLHNIRWLTPNMVTISMIILGPIATGLLLIPGPWGIIVFFLANQFWGIVDRIDGELARYKNIFSPAGIFLDNIAHLIIHACIYSVLGWKFYILSSNLIYLYLGLAAALIMTISGAIYHSGKFHALDKGVLSLENKQNAALIPLYFREIKAALVDHVEISVFASIAFLIYIYLFPNPLVPQIFLIGYLILITGGMILMIRERYLSLIQKKSH